MIWDQSADRLRFNDNADIQDAGTNSDFRIYHDNVDTFLYFNDRDLYFVDNNPATATIRGTWDSSGGTMLKQEVVSILVAISILLGKQFTKAVELLVLVIIQSIIAIISFS